MSASNRVTYRPELDGIRGLAVLLVVATHLALPGTYGARQVGVTMFFVLSGYLITSLIVAERERTGRIDVVDFYRRRARRLLPALALVMVIAAGLTIATGQAHRLVGDLLPIALYVSNWSRVGGADLGWLPQAWSLSVEEQFYLVWPLTLLIVRRNIALLCVIGIVGGVVARAIATSGGLGYGTFERGDAILYGALLTRLALPRLRLWPVALLTLGALVVQGPDFDVFSGWAPVASCVASMVLIADRPRFLAWRPLVEIGRRSYGIYLWHLFPVLIVRPFLPDPLAIAWVLAFTAIGAWASFRFLEAPIRSARRSHAGAGGALRVRDVVRVGAGQPEHLEVAGVVEHRHRPDVLA